MVFKERSAQGMPGNGAKTSTSLQLGIFVIQFNWLIM